MTFREKLQIDHPEYVSGEWANGCRGCPKDYGYEEYYDCRGIHCPECWDREIPEERVEKMEGKKMKTIVTVREPESCYKVTFEYKDIYEAITIMQECAKKGKVVEVEMRECDDSTDNH